MVKGFQYQSSMAKLPVAYRQLVKDYMPINGLKNSEVNIQPNLEKSVCVSKNKYRTNLGDQQKEN